MAKFLALYKGFASEAEKAATVVSSDVQAQGMAAWGQWMAQHATKILDGGGPLGATLKASPDGISTSRNDLTGYIIIEAESHVEAAQLFEKHPHFAIFPGDSVEIIECIPIPGM